MNFDSSWRGLPWHQRHVQKQDLEDFRTVHAWSEAPSLKNVEMIFVSVDVMDDYLSYAVIAFDVNDCHYLLECGETEAFMLSEEDRAKKNKERQAVGKPPIVAIEDIFDKDYLVEDGVGIRPYMIIIDQGGHRADEVKYFTRNHKMSIMQKGTSMTTLNWRMSENQSKLLLANEKYFKSLVIYILYSQKNRSSNYFYINPELSDEHIQQIVSVKPDNTSKWRTDYLKIGPRMVIQTIYLTA